MTLFTHPKSPHQFVGILLGVFGVLLGVGLFTSSCHFLNTQFGGAITPEEFKSLGIGCTILMVGFLGIAYSVYREPE